MIRKILTMSSIFGFIYIATYTNLIEDLFGCDSVAAQGGTTEYILLAIIIGILISRKK
jgi:hypothetical protein